MGPGNAQQVVRRQEAPVQYLWPLPYWLARSEYPLIPMNCRFCKAEIQLGTSNDDKLKRLQLCFFCDFWWDKVYYRANNDVDEKGNRVARVKGQHYIVYPDGSTPFQGFGGHEYVIKFHDGVEITTHNLWHQGEIPKRFRAHLPNNADFVDTRSTCSCRKKFYPMVPTQTKCTECVISAKPQRW